MPPVEHDHLCALDQMVHALETRWLPPYPDTPGYYGHEALPIPEFLAGMNTIGKSGGRTFLDMGCGIGDKLLLARLLGWDYVSGVDHHPPYLDVARELAPFASLYEGGALRFTGYGHFDVIYSYRLCIDPDDQLRLERHIAERAQPGTVLFLPHGVSTCLGTLLGPWIWRT